MSEKNPAEMLADSLVEMLTLAVHESSKAAILKVAANLLSSSAERVITEATTGDLTPEAIGRCLAHIAAVRGSIAALDDWGGEEE